MSIGFLENFKIFCNWGSKTYEYKYHALRKDTRFTIFDLPQETADLSGIKVMIFGWHGVHLNKYYTTKHRFYSKKIANLESREEAYEMSKKYYNVPVRLLLVQDLHTNDYDGGVSGLAKLVNEKFHGVITPYLHNPVMDRFRQMLKKDINVIHLPHHIDSNNFKERPVKKTKDVLLFGNDAENFYPFRNRLFNILKSSDLKINYLPKPTNYFRYYPKSSDAALSTLMNKSRLTVCTSSKFDYLLGKYFEASMSGSVICGNMPKDGEAIWGDNYLKLSPSMTDERIMDKIREFLDSDKDREISNVMLSRMNHYHLDQYANHMYSEIAKCFALRT